MARQDIADYVLTYRNHKLAVIEAKRRDLPDTEGVGQAKKYAEKLQTRFAYSTNGAGIYQVDMTTGAEQYVTGYPTPDELWNRVFAQRNVWRDRFAAIPFEDKGGYWQARYYQDIAIRRALEAIAAGQNRILLTLATGTGKTFIAFQLAWKLFQSRWNLADWKREAEPTRRPRILFLADRNILADQAYNAFSAFPEDALVRIDPETIRKKGRVPKNGNIFFTIFQTFMTGRDAAGQPAPSFGDYPPDFFDFIVIDECHRGGANDEGNWRAILTYFTPAVQLGLTATPKRQANADTYAYFGEPVYIYSLKDGINDGFLTPFKVQQIATTLDDYVYTSDDEVIEGEVEEGRRYTESDFNRIIEITARERLSREAVHGRHRPESEDTGLLRDPGSRGGGARPGEPDEDEHGAELLRPRDSAGWRARRPVPAHLPGQREDDSDDPDHVAKTFNRRRCAQRAQHRADAADQFDDRVQADHRPRNAPVRRQGLLHDL